MKKLPSNVGHFSKIEEIFLTAKTAQNCKSNLEIAHSTIIYMLAPEQFPKI